MSLDFETNTAPLGFYKNGFQELDKTYALHPPAPEEYQRYGKFIVTDTALIETPPDVLARGEVLTNPSQIEHVTISVNDAEIDTKFAYFRQEPTSFHLGKTVSVPYVLQRSRDGTVQLSEFTEALSLPGEDPRVMRDIKMISPTGKVYNGWCISTVIATAKPENPADVESIKQVFYWGQSLDELEPVLEIPNLKNACIFPVSSITGDESDTSIDVFGRPHPHITYRRIPSLLDVTAEMVQSGTNLTDGFLPEGVHAGVNMVKAVPGHPSLRELDIHEAYAPLTDTGKILHYRLGRYGVNLASGKLTPLGVVAARADFPHASAKPPENGVRDYTDILYGSMGDSNNGMMVTGVSDRHVGVAKVVRVA